MSPYLRMAGRQRDWLQEKAFNQTAEEAFSWVSQIYATQTRCLLWKR